jgi:AmmeMemoRadiSam system protein B
MFYPAGPDRLRLMVERMLAGAVPSPGPVRAIIVPHAGFEYSGPIAASAYCGVSPRDFDRAIVIGPSHFIPVDGAALCAVESFETPLGRVPVDTAAQTELAETPPFRIFEPAHRREHSLEVQLPFLQVALQTFRLIAVATGDVRAEEIADCIAGHLNERTLLVASSDLSHYHDYETAERLDRSTADSIVALEHHQVGPFGACGYTAVQVALVLARRYGWSCRLLDLRSSGDTAGDHRRVVGYGAFALG